MNTQTQQATMSRINQISIFTTDNTNTEYQITLLKNHLTGIVTDIDTRSMFVPDGKIGDAGAIALAEILKHNTTLKQLDIRNNNIGDKGAIALADSLKYNSAVRFIDLSYNKIGEKGIIALATAINQNTTLEFICLDEVDITEKGSLALVNISSRVWEYEYFMFGRSAEESTHENCLGCACCVPERL